MEAKTPRINLVITQVLLMENKTIYTIKVCLVSAISTIGPTTKDSCQVVYQDTENIIFHAKSRLMHLLVVAETATTNSWEYNSYNSNSILVVFLIFNYFFMFFVKVRFIFWAFYFFDIFFLKTIVKDAFIVIFIL